MNRIVLETICAALVTTHTRADLIGPDVIGCIVPDTITSGIQGDHDGVCGLAHIGFARTPIGDLFHTRGDVSDLKTVLMFISVLTTLACSREPAIGKISFITSIKDCLGPLTRENADRNGRGVNTPSAFGRGNSLDTMTTGFLLSEARNVFIDVDGRYCIRDPDGMQSALG